MYKLRIPILLLILFLATSSCFFAQGITSKHKITGGNLPNEFTIKTTIKGLEGVDLARVKYFISKKYTYKPVASNQFFSKIEDDYIKFYIMSIPTNGILEIELGVVLLGNDSLVFPVEFQYSKKDEKTVLNIDPIVINNISESTDELALNEKIKLAEETAKIEEAKQLQIKEDARNADETAAAALLASEVATSKQKEIEAANAKTEAEIVKKQAEARLASEKALAEEQLVLQKKEAAAAILLKEQEEAGALAKKEAEAAVLKQKEFEAANEKAEAEVASKKQAEARLAAEQESKSIASSGDKYGVQLFALSKYTDQKIKDYCKKNKLAYAEISILKVNGITKVRYGSVGTKEAASKLRKELLNRPQINGGFVVKL